MSSGSGMSNVGNRSLYEAGDQRNAPESEKSNAERYKEGVKNSHSNTKPMDDRSLVDRAKAEKKEEREKDKDSEETEMIKKDPTLLAKNHGNEPSKGAKIDKEIQDEEEEILKKKGSWGPKGS